MPTVLLVKVTLSAGCILHEAKSRIPGKVGVGTAVEIVGAPFDVEHTCGGGFIVVRIHCLVGDHDVAGLAVVITGRQAVFVDGGDRRQTYVVDQRAEFVCRAGALESERVVAGASDKNGILL